MAKRVRLEVGETKNEEARTIYLDEELIGIFSALWDNRKASKRILPYVFLNRSASDRIRDITKVWKKACNEVGFGVKVRHDFRRTAVRNMVRPGVSVRLAMLISGHKTRNVFDRYNTVNDQDLKLAAQKQSEYLKSLGGHNLGTVVHFGAQQRDGEIV